MKKWIKPGDRYVDILPEGNLVITAAESRRLLREIGLAGEILATPGHTDHCASLLLDNGAAFTGDLPPENLAFDNPTALASWKLLREKGARTVYPGHGPIRTLADAGHFSRMG
jgi:glyoxylase-like metal-dependent hydrolase (beta-lactamase superfamily II)